MPYPNLYLPAQVWLAALLHHSRLFSSGTAFKLAVLIPVLLLPLAVWIAAREITGRNTLAASGAVIVSLFLLRVLNHHVCKYLYRRKRAEHLDVVDQGR